MKTSVYFLFSLTHFFLEWKMFQTRVLEKIITHFMFTNFFQVLYWLWDNVKNIAEPDRPQMTIWHMHIACWITNLQTQAQNK